MNVVYPGDARYILDAYCIDAGELEFFDLGDHPIYREHFSFGGAPTCERGFLIGEDCIACGLCYENCPVEAIERL